MATITKFMKLPGAALSIAFGGVALLLLLLPYSPLLRHHSFPDLQTFVGTSQKTDLWSQKLQLQWLPCPWWTSPNLPALTEKSNGYLKIECTGGLNQMRRDLCDGVGIARLLNATLLLPHFDVSPYWNDTSGFADVFDVDFFINQMKGFLHVVRKLPDDLVSQPPALVDCRKRKIPFDYIEAVLPALLEHKVVAIRPSASQRLDRYPIFAKAARCQACYQAVRLVEKLEQVAASMVQKMPRPFLSLHLRFEPDMVAYSRCEYDNLSTESINAIKAVPEGREPFSGETALNWRKRGKCPLTPKETAFILHALHIPKDMPVYLATGDGILEKDSFMSMYPNVYTKNNLLDTNYLMQLGGNSKAALDYFVSINSDFFVATYFGNMDKMVSAMRALKRNWNTLILNRRAFAEACISGLNDTDLANYIWNIHREDFIKGRGTALPDCFCSNRIFLKK